MNKREGRRTQSLMLSAALQRSAAIEKAPFMQYCLLLLSLPHYTFVPPLCTRWSSPSLRPDYAAGSVESNVIFFTSTTSSVIGINGHVHRPTNWTWDGHYKRGASCLQSRSLGGADLLFSSSLSLLLLLACP